MVDLIFILLDTFVFKVLWLEFLDGVILISTSLSFGEFLLAVVLFLVTYFFTAVCISGGFLIGFAYIFKDGFYLLKSPERFDFFWPFF